MSATTAAMDGAEGSLARWLGIAIVRAALLHHWTLLVGCRCWLFNDEAKSRRDGDQTAACHRVRGVSRLGVAQRAKSDRQIVVLTGVLGGALVDRPRPGHRARLHGWTRGYHTWRSGTRC